jgi:hypothetical protein
LSKFKSVFKGVDRGDSPALAGGAIVVQGVVLGFFILDGIVIAPVALPLIPVNSPAWSTVSDINGELNELIGWPARGAKGYHRHLHRQPRRS